MVALLQLLNKGPGPIFGISGFGQGPELFSGLPRSLPDPDPLNIIFYVILKLLKKVLTNKSENILFFEALMKSFYHFTVAVNNPSSP